MSRLRIFLLVLTLLPGPAIAASNGTPQGNAPKASPAIGGHVGGAVPVTGSQPGVHPNAIAPKPPAPTASKKQK
ncbi:MAG TPA: hypothetical protein VMI56_23010 [Reyranella sp.]|nr:hypothetical protein [Reyranella sp.]